MDHHPSTTPLDDGDSNTTAHYSTPSPFTHPVVVAVTATTSTSTSTTSTSTSTTSTDTCPPASHGQDDAGDMDDDDDYAGGISLVDMQHFIDTAVPAIGLASQDAAVAAPVHALVAQFPSWPPHPSFANPLSSSESSSSLEPPPILHEPNHCAYDKAAFIPITSFFHRIAPQRPTVPGLDLQQLPPTITRHQLQGDRYDCQGIDWSIRNTTRAAVRARRVQYETDRLSPLERGFRKCIRPTPNHATFFQFRRNNLAHRAFVPHYQLRNIIAATSRNDVFYVAGKKVFRADADSHTDAHGTEPEILTDLNKRIRPESLITTLSAQDDTLVTGAFDGEYSITNLASTYGSAPTVGRTSLLDSPEKSRIVNHLHLFPSRHTSSPQAVFCSNNSHLQILDCTTNTFTHTFAYPDSPNCAATSPDARLRVVVGDFRETLITNAETGRPFEALTSHHDAAFACAWADDGIHVATAAQDSTMVVWDARYWQRPLKIMSSELSVPRSLRFSPTGSGPRVLVSAEADDYVNIVDAVSWESKQVVDFFGPIGGVAFSPDGQALFVANTERRFGGVVELERVAWAGGSGEERRTMWEPEDDGYSWGQPRKGCGVDEIWV